MNNNVSNIYRSFSLSAFRIMCDGNILINKYNYYIMINARKLQLNLFFYREEVTKWYGWGYIDSNFYFKDGNIRFSGNR